MYFIYIRNSKCNFDFHLNNPCLLEMARLESWLATGCFVIWLSGGCLACDLIDLTIQRLHLNVLKIIWRSWMSQPPILRWKKLFQSSACNTVKCSSFPLLWTNICSKWWLIFYLSSNLNKLEIKFPHPPCEYNCCQISNANFIEIFISFVYVFVLKLILTVQNNIHRYFRNAYENSWNLKKWFTKSRDISQQKRLCESHISSI